MARIFSQSSMGLSTGHRNMQDQTLKFIGYTIFVNFAINNWNKKHFENIKSLYCCFGNRIAFDQSRALSLTLNSYHKWSCSGFASEILLLSASSVDNIASSSTADDKSLCAPMHRVETSEVRHFSVPKLTVFFLLQLLHIKVIDHKSWSYTMPAWISKQQQQHWEIWKHKLFHTDKCLRIHISIHFSRSFDNVTCSICANATDSSFSWLPHTGVTRSHTHSGDYEEYLRACHSLHMYTHHCVIYAYVLCVTINAYALHICTRYAYLYLSPKRHTQKIKNTPNW